MVEESDSRGALRDFKLSQAVEKFSEARLLVRFFQTGSLVPLSLLAPCTDEEYVGNKIVERLDNLIRQSQY